MDYITVKDIEIVKTGTHDTGGGPVSITSADITNMVAAAATGLLPKPVVKIGHVNAAVENPEWGDGEPAYGQLDNLRASEDGSTLIADWVNAPKDLADKQPSAYPNRSLEATFGMELKDEDGNVSESYPAVLTGVALLGATAPAVKSLAEVHAAFSAAGRKVFASGGKSLQIRASLPGGRTSNELGEALREAVHALEQDGEWLWMVDFTDTHAFYQQETPGGSTWQRAYTLGEDGKVQWTGEPVEVIPRHTFEPVQSDPVTVPQSEVAASESAGTDAAKPVATPDIEGDTPMLSKETLAALRKQLELPEDATVEDIAAAVTKGEPQPVEEPATGAQDGDKTETTTETPGQEQSANEPELVAASTGTPGVVQLSQANFDDFVSQFSEMKVELSAIKKEKAEKFVDEQIARAKQAGKIHPNDEGQLRVLFSAAPQEAAKYLENLTPIIPTRELGTPTAVHASGDDEVENAKRDARRALLGIDQEAR